MLALVHVALRVLADAPPPIPNPLPIPNPPPAAPPAGANAVNTIIGWTKWGALACCVAAFAIGGGMIAFGNTSRRAEMAERGKVTIVCAVAGAILVGVGGTLVSSAFGLG